MTQLRRAVCLFATLLFFTSATAVGAAEMTFQFVNGTERALNLKLFSRGESLRQWPARTKAYSLRPDSAVQQLKVSCDEGEPICWGAWLTVQSVSGEVIGGQRNTRTGTVSAGVGERGIRDCPTCCHVCKDGTVTPPTSVRLSSATGSDVR